MVKHTQRIRWQKSTNCFSVFDQFVGLTRKGLGKCTCQVLYKVVVQLSILVILDQNSSLSCCSISQTVFSKVAFIKFFRNISREIIASWNFICSSIEEKIQITKLSYFNFELSHARSS